MSKVITSPVKRWPGTVVISDPLTFPQVFAFEDGINAVQAEKESGLSNSRGDWLVLPGVIACVEQWNLTGFPEAPTPETFPATPRLARARLLAWLISEIVELYQEAETVPNE